MRSTIFWNVTPYSLVDVHRLLGRRHQVERSDCYLLLARCLFGLLFDPERAVRSFETSKNYRTTRRHIPEDSILKKITWA
jgi:hypothetical protein